MIPANIRQTIEAALLESRESRGGMTKREWEEWQVKCDAALTWLAQQDAPQPLPMLDTERAIIEAMADDWLERFEPGSDEWADAQVLRAWLDNYRGTMYDAPQPQPVAPDAAGGQPPVFVFDWDAIPPDYEWATVEVYNDLYDQCWQVHAHLYEPRWSKEFQGWVSDGDYEHMYLVLDLPLGLDHRVLKQRRPAPTPDSSEEVEQ